MKLNTQIKELDKTFCKWKNDLYYNHKTKNPIHFFQNSLLHYAICLEIGIGFFQEKFLSYENLCDKIPKRFGSRSTIQSVLNQAIRENYFTKEVSLKDGLISVAIGEAAEKSIKENRVVELKEFNL